MGKSDLHIRRLEASKSKNEYIRDPFCWARIWGHDWIHYLMGLFINPIIWLQNFILECWRNSFIGVLIISAGYFATLFVLASHLNDEIKLLSKVEIKSWDDRRNLGLSVAGIIGGWLALLGLYYSAKRTRALDEDNRIKLNVSRQNSFLEAVNLLKDESPFVVAGAIESLNKIGMEPDARYFSDTLHLLAAFIRDTSNKRPDNHTNQQMASNDIHYNNVQAAFDAILKIINAHSDATFERHFGVRRIDLRESKLHYLELLHHTEIKNLNLSFCKLQHAKFVNCSFVRTQLYGADLSDADFTKAKFDPPSHDMITTASMRQTIISGCDFNNVNIWKKDQLATCRYHLNNPPRNISREITANTNLVEYTQLTTPFDFDMEIVPEGQSARHLTLEEAKDFYNEKSSYRPLDGDGYPITPIAPDAPDNPIIA